MEDQHIAEALTKEWGLIVTGTFTKAHVVDSLALKLASVIEQGPDPFFQLMYRLDIPERQLNRAMYDKNAVMEIAVLVYNRQLQKMRSRQFYKKDNGDSNTDEELGW